MMTQWHFFGQNHPATETKVKLDGVEVKNIVENIVYSILEKNVTFLFPIIMLFGDLAADGNCVLFVQNCPLVYQAFAF